MGLYTANICLDADNPIAQARWWAEVLDDFTLEDEEEMDPNEAGLRGPGGRWLLFLKVPEPKTVKNRMHLCLRSVDTDRDAEVERLLGLGATMVDDRRELKDGSWAVLADPEGNEFCILMTPAPEVGITRG